MVLRPPRQIRISAQTRLIRCEYPTKEDVAKNSFKVGDLRTVTDLPSTTFSDENPTHELIVMDLHNNPVDKAEPGTGLIGKFRISTIPYVASIKNCYLKPDQKGNITGHQIINEFGCPVDQDVTVWRWDPKTNSLQFTFKAFKFLDWKENHISCQVNYCLKKSDCAPPSNCEDTPKPCEEPKM
ncbi:uncharacterized protein LOC123265884 [Cotesia glomerata]|uniref:uncharacterized protein LOC123265884 n=1 Tax=Cotesia glomerata TaxID=32391 RepID=UPI001D01CFB6|nr:uncharacterized protein LOC123265884 [Cotesia glomerata]